MAWSAAAREAARQRCLANQPWLRSTGPRTPEGRAASSLNALKHGLYCRNTIVAVLGKALLSQQQYEQARQELGGWLVDAIALKKANPRLYEELVNFAEQTENELS